MKNNLLIKIGIFFDDFVSKIISSKTKKRNNKIGRKASLTKGIPVLSKLKKNSEKSQIDSQGVSRFAGSSYNGHGNVDNAKIRYNRKRR